MTIDEFVATVRAFQESRVLLTALELDVFSAVGSGAAGASVADAIGADPRSTTMLLDALVAIGVLNKRDGRYANSDLAARHLTSASAQNLRPGLLHQASLWRTWSTLTDAVRAGTAVHAPGIEARAPDWTEAFIAAMHQNAMRLAPGVVAAVGTAGVRRMLDVGGGSGAYAIEFARRDDGLRADILDTAAVAPIAERHISAAGAGGSVRVIVGDLRHDPLGSAYDLVLLSAICHMLGADENRDLLRRAFEATAPGGRVVIRDFILDPDRTSPRPAALFALNMLVGTRGGSTYTAEEYRTWLEEAGYRDVQRAGDDGELVMARRV